MTPTTLRYRLNELGLTQNALARLLGDTDSRNVRRWCSGAQDIPPWLEGRLEAVTEAEVMQATAKDTDPRQWGLRADRWVGNRRGGQR